MKNTDLAETLLSLGTKNDNISVSNETGSALQIAAAYGSIKMLRMLLDKGAKIDNAMSHKFLAVKPSNEFNIGRPMGTLLHAAVHGHSSISSNYLDEETKRA